MENAMKKTLRSLIGFLCIAQLAFTLGCGGKQPAAGEDSHGPDGHGDHTPQSITMTPEAVAAVGVQTAPALRRSLSRLVSAPGELEFNARRTLHVTARAAGRIERTLAVAGDKVSRGQLLAEIYSPEYMARQAEFLQATARAERLKGNGDEAGAARAFMAGARERLLLLGISHAEASQLVQTGTPQPYLPVRAQFSGTIIESAAQAGDHVELGSSLFRLSDLSILWASLNIQEKDLSALQAGSVAEIRSQAFPGELFHGRLLVIGGMLDAQTRTVIGRVEVPNPSSRLKAGMYIEAILAGAKSRTALVVPESALQDDNGRPVVFVQTRSGVFVRREVVIGERFQGGLEILAGLAEGEQVVTSGGFLLKSDLHKGSLEDEHGHS
jgi:Cu(I)/Ag(I) efflux system membrane fusion protein